MTTARSTQSWGIRTIHFLRKILIAYLIVMAVFALIQRKMMYPATMSRKGTPPAGLVLVATFSSMLDVAAAHFRWLPVRWLLLDRYRSDKAIAQVTCPILQFHGDLDTLVALPFGRRLYELVHAKSSGGIAKEFHLLRGAGHNDILDRYGRFIRDEMAALM